MPLETQPSPSPNHHTLQCMEVWGGSDHAEHIASVPGLDISVHARPIGDQGGDLYLISSCSSGWITRMLLADVAGHGDIVSDLSAKLRKAMHKSINTVDQSKLAKELNQAFDAFSKDGRFATALLMTYFSQTGHLILVNAGHPPPLIQRAGETRWIPIDADAPGVLTQTCKDVRVGFMNLPLGVIGDTEYEQIAIPIREGDRVCAYTDAYSESVKPDGRQLGVNGLSALLERVSASRPDLEGVGAGLQRVMDKEGIVAADDDHSLIVLERNAQSRPGLTLPVMGNWLKSNFGLGHTDTTPE